ncbi:recombination protein RecR [bacterium]|nr:recombination protein RecR [bacterium]
MSTSPIEPLVEQLVKLPGVGQKSAQRLAFHILSMPLKDVDVFSEVIKTIRRDVRYCESCFNLTLATRCVVCENPRRDGSRLCVVSNPRDIVSIERTLEYSGVYHVLGGLISPLDGVTPESLRISELIQRLKIGQFTEILLAINPTIEGEATLLYLASVLRPLGVTITQLAYGIPVGGELEFADELTLQRALSSRVPIT